MAWGSFKIPTGFDGSTISYEVSIDSGVSWAALLKEDNTAHGDTAVAVGGVYNFPSSVFNAQSVRLISASQTGEVVIPVHLKG